MALSENPIDVETNPSALNNKVQLNTITKQLRYFLNIPTTGQNINFILQEKKGGTNPPYNLLTLKLPHHERDSELYKNPQGRYY